MILFSLILIVSYLSNSGSTILAGDALTIVNSVNSLKSPSRDQRTLELPAYSNSSDESITRELWGTWPTAPTTGNQWALVETLNRPPKNQSSFFGMTTAMTTQFLFVGAPATCGTGTQIESASAGTSCAGMANPSYSQAYGGSNGLGQNGNGIGNGTVYVYRYINRFRQWTLFQNLSVPGSYEFGYSIVVKGNIAVISAPRTGSTIRTDGTDLLSEPLSSSGAVYVFQYNYNNQKMWVLTQTIREPSYNYGGVVYNTLNFGFSIDLSPDYSVLLVGAPVKDTTTVGSSASTTYGGSAWIYSYNFATNRFVHTGSGAGKSFITLGNKLWFGASVAVGRSTAVPTNTWNTIAVSDLEHTLQSIYIFTKAGVGKNWTELAWTSSAQSPLQKTDYYYGYNIRFANGTLLVGDIQLSGPGQVFTYDYNPSTKYFSQTQVLSSGNNPKQYSDFFGLGIGVGDNDTIIVAASPKSFNAFDVINGFFIFSKSASSGLFTQTAFVNVFTSFTFMPFVSMITNPNPQVLVGGSPFELTYKARYYNFTRAPDPTMTPSSEPTSQPSRQPTRQPVSTPSSQPSHRPTTQPTARPSRLPSSQPTKQPSSRPSTRPSAPTTFPSIRPTRPTSLPSTVPSASPSSIPSILPSAAPSTVPSNSPSYFPSTKPSNSPSSFPSVTPSVPPTTAPSIIPSISPSTAPSISPTSPPSYGPTFAPSSNPSINPTFKPTVTPSLSPSFMPSVTPSMNPSATPSVLPTLNPSIIPSFSPSTAPSISPSFSPSAIPSPSPSDHPSGTPSIPPSTSPSISPSNAPSLNPSISPSTIPSFSPSAIPSSIPSYLPSITPSATPTMSPTFIPSSKPSATPSLAPSGRPSITPSTAPSSIPSVQPSNYPSALPSITPSTLPSVSPSKRPSLTPTFKPSSQPSAQPSRRPTSSPSTQPSFIPSPQPSSIPSSQPSSSPSTQPSPCPSTQPSAGPSKQPSSKPSAQPSSKPSHQPLSSPSNRPSSNPSSQPTTKPSSVPTNQPSSGPSTQPTSQPSSAPTTQPSTNPSQVPHSAPTSQPTSKPSCQPSTFPTGNPTVVPTTQPSAIPSNFPSSIPSSQPSSQPTERPSNEPSLEPTGQPSSQPSTMPSNIPTSHPSVSYRPSVQPTTFAENLVTKCSIRNHTTNSATFKAYFIVHHFINNTSATEFDVVGANNSFIHTVQCVLNGVYSILPVKVNITNLYNHDQHNVEVRYIVEFIFPVPLLLNTPNAYHLVTPFYGNLTQQLISNVVNQHFTTILRQYCISNKACFKSAASLTPPQVFGPFLLTPQPTLSPVAIPVKTAGQAALNVILDNLGLILGLGCSLICVLLTISSSYYYYLQRKIARETEMQKWQESLSNKNADIEIFVNKFEEKSDKLRRISGKNPLFHLNGNPRSRKGILDKVSQTVRSFSRKLSRSMRGGDDPNSHSDESEEMSGSYKGDQKSTPRFGINLNSRSGIFQSSAGSVKSAQARSSCSSKSIHHSKSSSSTASTPFSLPEDTKFENDGSSSVRGSTRASRRKSVTLAKVRQVLRESDSSETEALPPPAI